MADKKRSPWLYVGIGCAALILLTLVAVGGLVWYGARAAKRFAEEINDPVAREAKVKRVLGAETLPDGYQPFMAMSIPMVMDMAILSDHAPGQGGRGSLGGHGFLYMSVIGGSAGDRKNVRDYMAGRTQRSIVLERQKVNLSGTEVLSHGEFQAGGATVGYAVQRGAVEYAGMRQTGLQAFMLFECPNDSRNRIGIWFLPDQDASAEASSEEAPVAAAPASAVPDETAIRAFVAPFHVCGK